MSPEYRILLLEDDPDMCASLAEVLEEEGYEVVTAHAGVDAVEKAGAAPFDLMITDVRMAGMDGLEALTRVKQSLPDVASLVITGYAGDADSIRALRLGAGDYLKKPFELSDFLASVERLLSRRRAELERRGRESALRCLAVAALDALAVTQHGSTRPGRLAAALARELGYDTVRAEELRIAAELAHLRHHTAVQPLLHQVALPPSIKRALRAADDDSTDAAALPNDVRLVLAALALAADEPVAERVLDPALRAAIEAVTAREGQEEAEDERPSHGPQLVSLACALEAAGDVDGADRAFERAASHAGARREAVDALLGRARLAAAAGRIEDAAVHLDHAVSRAQSLGPVTGGRGLLEAGLVWLRLGHDERARPLLQRAATMLAEVQAEPHASLARLAHGEPDENALQVLARPEFADDRVAAAPWLLGRLASAPDDAVTDRLIGRLVREVPRQVGVLLERGVLKVEARRRLVAALAAEGKAPLQWAPSAEHDEDAEVRRLARSRVGDGQPEPPPLLRLHAMGPFEAWMGETRIPDSAWVSSKVKHMCAFLAAQNGADVSEDVLIERFWPGDLDKGRRSLYNAKAVLAKCLQPGQYVVRQRGMIRLDLSLPCWHDATDIERLAAEAARRQRDGQHLAALDAWRRLSALYRGPYLDGCFLDWALEVRARLERLASLAMTRLMEDALQRGQHEEAIEYGSRLLDIDACNQEAHGGLMQAYLASGRPEQAVRQFETCRRKLRAELELEPSIALVEMQQRARLAL